MIRKRQLLAVTLLALFGAGGPQSASAAAEGTRQVIAPSIPLEGCSSALRLDLTFTIPATIAPGERVDVTDISTSFSYGESSPIMGRPYPTQVPPTIKSLSFSAVGTQDGVLAPGGVPRTLPSIATNHSNGGTYSWGFGWNGSIGSTGSTIASGTGPVVITAFGRSEAVQYGYEPGVAPSITSCRPSGSRRRRAISR